MRTIILFLSACLLFSGTATAQQLTAAEYFVDTDPGTGNGTAVSVTSGNTASAQFAVDGTSIPEGFHTLSTRFKDSNGTWGLAVSRLFYVYGNSTGNSDPAPPIAAAEYFIDTDPGAGLATPFAVSQGDQVSATFSVDGSGLLEGFHTLSVRLKDTEGHWSLAVSRLFYVYGGGGGGTQPAPPIAAAEYFFDVDPGVGHGTALPTGAPQDVASVNTVIDASTLPIGTHVLNTRFKDTSGHWGIAEARPFVVLPPGALQNDECLGATVLPLQTYGACPGSGTPGSTEDATVSSASTCWGGEYADVWYQVNSGSSPQITIDVTEVSAQDVRVEVMDACDGNVLYCLSNFPQYWGATPNTTYWLRVFAATADGSFGICVSGAQADCLGELGGSATPGSACDDGDPLTINDQYQANCSCQGYDCYGVLGGPDVIGTPCLYSNALDGTPIYGVRDENCQCSWTDCEGLANGNDFPGQPCDDGIVGNNATYWSTACTCADYYDCNGVVNGPLVAGSPCLYSNALDGTPIYGVRDENCQCSWTDCEGLANGNDFPGQPCDDGIVGNNATYWSTACTCADYYDCNGVVNGPLVAGSPCLYSNALDGTPIYGVRDENCQCSWTDCEGLANGNDFPGQPCDDGIVGNNATYWSTACTCADYYDCNGVVNGPLVAGSPCLYSNALDGTPIYGVRDENCQCSWTDCEGLANGNDFPGQPCDDGIAGNNDTYWSSSCTCTDYSDCEGVVNGPATLGSPCSFPNAPLGTTGVWNASCQCEWTDCNGDLYGSAYFDNCATCVGGNTGLVPCTNDCNGVPGGTAFIDNCSTCVGGNTGLTACVQDCNGEYGGTAFLDNCSACVGGSTGQTACVQDCHGDYGGTAYLDNCATCVGGNTGLEPCTADCNGDLGGTAYLDNCATCVGGNTGLIACVADCHGDFGGSASMDQCNVCSGGNTGIVPNSTCADCAGVPNGTSVLDACGTCRLPNDPNFQTANRTLSFTGVGNFQNAVLYPQTGEPSDTYTAEVIYSNSENGQLPLGYPRLILDYEGDGSFNGPFDRTVLMVATDASDVTTTDGNRYRCTVVGLPTGMAYQTRVQVAESYCLTEIGPFNYPDVLVAPDLEIFANDITFSDPNPEPNSPLTVFAKVHNRADYPAEGFTVRLVNEFEPGTVYPEIIIPSLAAHDTLTVSWNITTPNVPAWCPMHVTVDVNDVIAETNELNNAAIRPFVNGDFNLPGTIHVYASVSPAQSVIAPASYEYITVSGYAYYSGTAVALADSSVAGATVTIQGHFGETYTVLTNSQGYFWAEVLAMMVPGTFSYTGSVTDYTLTGTLEAPYERILGCPVGYGVGVTIDQFMDIGGYNINAILTGETISGSITVTNSTCEDVLVPTRLDAAQTGGLPIIDDVIVPPLAAGETFTLPFSGIQFDDPGYFTICGTSDADYVLDDLNYHNSYCQGLTVFPRLPDIQPDYYGGIGEAFQCQVGEPSFRVWNHGAVPTGPFDCRVDVYRDGDFVQSFTHTISNIGQFTNTGFSIPYVPPAVGNYAFVLECDVPLPNGSIDELDEGNNAATYIGSTIACQADLSVYFPCELPVTPVDPQVPGTVTYHAVISNSGNAIAQGPIDVTFEVNTGGTYTTQYAGDLAPSESAMVEVNAPTVASATAHLTAIVDPNNTVTEFNEGDSALDELCHEYYPTVCYDWGWPLLPVLGQTTAVSVVLAAEHLYTASQVKVRFEVSGPDIAGTALLGDVMVDPAQARCYCGVGVTLPGSFLFSSEGTYTFTFTVDPDNEYTECNEGNNVLTRDILITNLPDLRVLSQYINPSLLNPDVNEPVTLDVTYENIGYGNPGSTFDLRVMANNDELATVTNVPGLITGGTHTVSIPVPFSSPLVGVHVFRAIIDANDVVVEGDELNNEATRAIVVGAAANLYFASFTASTQTPTIGQLLTMQTTVGNNGDLPIDGDVTFYYVTTAGDTIQIGPSTHVSLDSSQTIMLNRAWTVAQLPRAMIARISNASALEFTYSDNEARIPMGALTVQLASVAGCDEGPLGSLSATVFGGVAPYSFVWSNDSVGNVLHAAPGTYSVTISDAEGRATTGLGTIAEAPGCNPVDCYGDPGGTAFMDECDVCVGGNTGLTACVADCNGIFGGTALPGTSCDDGNANTTGDLIQANCSCVGTPVGNCTNYILEFQNDANPDQVIWEVLDAVGTSTVASGIDLFPATSIGTQIVCLPDGCYQLRVTDNAGDGLLGYILRETGANGRRIIDNAQNMIMGVSQIFGGGAFCLPIGDDHLIISNCDKLDWVTNKFIVCNEDPLVSAQYTAGWSLANYHSGYVFWFYDPNGSYSYRRLRNHANSDGYGTGATRACHFRLNAWTDSPGSPHLPEGVLLNVRVRARVSAVNQEWGPACQFKMDAALAACPRVNLQDNPALNEYSCDVNRVFGGSNHWTNRVTASQPQPVPGVSSSLVRYQFRFRIPGEEVCIVRPPQTSPRVFMNWSAASGQQLECGKQYEVDVRVSLDGGANWCFDVATPSCVEPVTPWGKVCMVNITSSTYCPGELQGGSSSMATDPSTSSGSVTMYPNPNRGDQLYINLSAVDADVNTVSVDIYDLTGKRVTARTIAVQDGFVKANIDLNNELAGGLYMVNITAGDKTYTERLVIQK